VGTFFYIKTKQKICVRLITKNQTIAQ